MERAFDRGLLGGVGLVVALLTAGAGLAYRNTNKLDEDARWVSHTHEVLDLTSDVLLAVVDAETGQRGYLLTGKAEFLQPYDAARARLADLLAALKEKTRDNDRQQVRINSLEGLIAVRLGSLQEGIDLRRRSEKEAQALVASGPGQAQTDAIRNLVADMEREEHALLEVRRQQSRTAYAAAVVTGLITAAAGLAAVGAFVALVYRSLASRIRAATVIERERERFRVTLASIGDAVIVTDDGGRITFLNAVAETLTGWAHDALGKELPEVFRIVNEQTGVAVESPVAKVLRAGAVAGLANHTILVARDGTRRPIDDSGAPIREATGQVSGVVLVFRDVTQRRELERLQGDLQAQLERQVRERTEQLRQSEERYRILVDGTTDYAIFLLDPQGRVISWNPGAERIKGYTAEQILGQHFSRFYPREDVDAGKPARELETAAARGKYEEEGWRVRKDGSLFWASVLITALRDDAGGLRGFSKITRDMTQRKEAEEAARRLAQERAAREAAEAAAGVIRAQREQLRVTLESIGDAVIATDAEGRVTLLNPVAQALTGWGPEEAAGRPLGAVLDIKNEQTGRPAENPVARVLREGVVVGLANHTALTARDGTVRPIEDSAAPIKDEQGRTRGVVLVFHDVTERRRAERAARFLADASAALAALADRESTLQKVARLAVPFFADWCAVDMLEADGLPHRVAVAHVDPSRVRLAHELHRRYPPDPAASYGVWHILRTGESEMTPEITDAMLAATVKDEELLRTLRQLGLRSYIGVPIRVRDRALGVLTFVAAESGRRYGPADLAVAQDLGQRVAIAVENARLYGELKEADRKKDEFLAMLAHELRNPLAPLRNATQILRMPGADAATAGRARDMIERQIQHLVRLVDDLLDVSRIMRGKIELRKEPVTVAAVVARAVETAQPAIDAPGHRLEVSLPAEPVWVEADPVRLAQVVSNLLNNSAKYMEAGGLIRLTAERQGEEVVLRVRDSGIGIAPEVLPYVFDLFVQAEHGVGRAQGGLGIGLTLVKRLVELHGGRVSASSEGLGKGSEFVVRLPAISALSSPLSALSQASGEAAPAPAGPPRRILVVDDNVDAAESLAMILRLEGQEVRVAHDGPSALEAAPVYRPEVVFLDIGMPGMDGYEVARRLRQVPGLEGTVLIALTGWGQDQDRRRSQEAGFDRHLLKPVERRSLAEVLGTLGRMKDEG
jgi:PAS domain S-box-containing protein